MSKKKSQSEVEAIVSEYCKKHNYTYEPFKYINARAKNITIICDKGHRLIKNSSQIMGGHKCSKCGKHQQAEVEAIVSEYCKKHNYTYEPFKYKDSRTTNIPILCDKGHIILKRFSNITNGSKCCDCVRNKKKSQSEVEAIVSEYCKKHNYTYEPFKYKDSRTPNIPIICDKGHIDYKYLNKIKLNRICSKCAIGFKKTQSEAVSIVKKYCKERNYTYKPFKYINGSTKNIIIKCNICGNEAPKKLYGILQGKGCNYCKYINIPPEKLGLWERYKLDVLKYTTVSKKIIDAEWDGTDYIDGEYIRDYFELDKYDRNYPELDHKQSKLRCFELGVSAEICGGVNNLGYTKKQHNASKQAIPLRDYLKKLKKKSKKQ